MSKHSSGHLAPKQGEGERELAGCPPGSILGKGGKEVSKVRRKISRYGGIHLAGGS
jgi:hypothetical protein